MQCIACHLIIFYGMAWYCISFGLIARYHTVMYRCYSAPANYRVVHLVIFYHMLLIIYHLLVINNCLSFIIYYLPLLHSELWLVWPPVDSAPVCSSLTEQSSRGAHHLLSCASTTGEATCPAPADYIGICHGSKIGFVSKVTVDLSQQAVDISLSLTHLSV